MRRRVVGRGRGRRRAHEGDRRAVEQERRGQHRRTRGAGRAVLEGHDVALLARVDGTVHRHDRAAERPVGGLDDEVDARPAPRAPAAGVTAGRRGRRGNGRDRARWATLRPRRRRSAAPRPTPTVDDSCPTSDPARWQPGPVPGSPAPSAWTQVVDAVTGPDSPHTVLGLVELGEVALPDLLVSWRLAAAPVRVALPAPGDVRGLPGPVGLRAEALAAGEAVVVGVVGRPGTVAVPEIVDYSPSSRPTTVRWRVRRVESVPPDHRRRGRRPVRADERGPRRRHRAGERRRGPLARRRRRIVAGRPARRRAGEPAARLPVPRGRVAGPGRAAAGDARPRVRRPHGRCGRPVRHRRPRRRPAATRRSRSAAPVRRVQRPVATDPLRRAVPDRNRAKRVTTHDRRPCPYGAATGQRDGTGRTRGADRVTRHPRLPPGVPHRRAAARRCCSSTASGTARPPGAPC